MKKLLLASIILMKLALNAQSSVYKPFCNNPSWTVVTENFGMASYTTYQYQTDTIIGTYSYKKSKDISGSSFVLFREDIAQKKVYQYDLTNSLDYLYIDFNLNYGDPFNLTLGGSVYSLTVCTKDSMLINGCYHNKIVLSNDGCFVRYNFVEGILSDVNPINPFTWPGDPLVTLTCECHNGQFYYNNYGNQFNPYSCYLTCSPASTCSTTTNINELSIIQSDVYPNPANDIVNFKFEDAIEKMKIEIYDAVGALLISQDVNAKSISISTDKLSNGIYFYHVVQKGKTIKTDKIIIIK